MRKINYNAKSRKRSNFKPAPKNKTCQNHNSATEHKLITAQGNRAFAF